MKPTLFVAACAVATPFATLFAAENSTSSEDIAELRRQVEALTQTVRTLQSEVKTQQNRWDNFNAPATEAMDPQRSRATAKPTHTCSHHHGGPGGDHAHGDHSGHDHGSSSRPFGLEISGAVDFVTSYSHSADQVNFTPREVELEIAAQVDDFARAWITLNAHSVLDPTANNDFLEHTSVHLEEAAIATTNLPWGLTLKGGQFFADFTLNGKTHAHSLPFVDRPYSLDAAIGGETIARGFELHWVPEPAPQLHFTLGVVDGMGEYGPATNRLFTQEADDHGHSHGSEDGVFGNWRNRAPRSLMVYGRAAAALEPTAFTNLDLGLNYAQSNGRTERQIASADVRFRWQPNGLKPDELEFGAEAIWSRQHGPFSSAALSHRYQSEHEHDDHGHDHDDHGHEGHHPGSNVVTSSQDGSTRVAGGYAWLQYRMGSWIPGVRVDYTRSSLYEIDSDDYLARFNDKRWTWSTYLTFLASEKQRFRLQLSYVDGDRPLYPGGKTHDVQAFLQWTVLLGDHHHHHP